MPCNEEPAEVITSQVGNRLGHSLTDKYDLTFVNVDLTEDRISQQSVELSGEIDRKSQQNIELSDEKCRLSN